MLAVVVSASPASPSAAAAVPAALVEQVEVSSKARFSAVMALEKELIPTRNKGNTSTRRLGDAYERAGPVLKKAAACGKFSILLSDGRRRG